MLAYSVLYKCCETVELVLTVGTLNWLWFYPQVYPGDMVAHYVFCLGPKGAFRVVTFPGLNTYAFDLMIGPQVGPIGRFGRLTFLTDMARVGVSFVVLFHMGPVNSM